MKVWCPYCLQETDDRNLTCPVCGASITDGNLPNQLQVGQELVNGPHHYRIGKVLGSGGFGITYTAMRLEDGLKVAIKEYFPNLCMPQRFDDGTIMPGPGQESIYEGGRYSFVMEAKMISSLEGLPSIVQGLDYLECNNTAYLVMEYLDGTPLYRIVQNEGRMSYDRLMPPMHKLMLDIAALHNRDVIHRDISPDNITLMPDGSLKLIDFGCARSMENGKSMTVALKKGFAPPEQYGTHGQGPWTDVYALSATIYYCLTGLIPPESTSRMMDGVEITPPTKLGAALTPEEEEALMWGLSVKSQDRPQNMKQLAVRMFPEDIKKTVQTPPTIQEIPQTQTQPQPSQGGSGPYVPGHQKKISLWDRIKAWLGIR